MGISEKKNRQISWEKKKRKIGQKTPKIYQGLDPRPEGLSLRVWNLYGGILISEVSSCVFLVGVQMHICTVKYHKAVFQSSPLL